MRFDSNQAWKDAASAVSANRDVLLALAGVFFVLPSFAFSVFYPQPEPPAGAEPAQLFELMGAFYRQAWPVLLAIAAVQMVGTLAMLALFTDRSRPTVGQALAQGVNGLLPVIAAQLLLGMGMGLVALIPLAAAGATGVAAAVALVIVLVAAVMLWAYIRSSLVSPAVMVDGIRNPVAALRRSFALTKGNAGRIAVFFLLLVVAFVIVVGIASALFGLVAEMVVGGETATTLTALVSSAGEAVMAVYFVAVVAATHRQLAGPSAEITAARFE